jgi:predicted aspartyl protease
VTQSNDIVRFHLRDKYLIVVEVKVNNAGPFKFLVDTGTTRTVIDPGLAHQLQAPAIGKVSLTGMLHQRQDELVRIENLQLGGASSSGLGVIVDKLARQKTLAPGIRGVLGEDFLSRFDFFIDYKRQWVRFGGSIPAGERCRFETIGQHNGSPTINRLLILTEFIDGGTRELLQLDTGARVPELFPASHDTFSSPSWEGTMAISNGADEVTIDSNAAIKIGSTVVRGLDVVQSRRSLVFDAAGLLPAAIFRSIYISHSGGFVVLNPGE